MLGQRLVCAHVGQDVAEVGQPQRHARGQMPRLPAHAAPQQIRQHQRARHQEGEQQAARKRGAGARNLLEQDVDHAIARPHHQRPEPHGAVVARSRALGQADARRLAQQAEEGGERQQDRGQLAARDWLAKQHERGQQRNEERQALRGIAAHDARMPQRRGHRQKDTGQQHAQRRQHQPRRLRRQQTRRVGAQHQPAEQGGHGVVHGDRLAHVHLPTPCKLQHDGHRDAAGDAGRKIEKARGQGHAGPSWWAWAAASTRMPRRSSRRWSAAICGLAVVSSASP